MNEIKNCPHCGTAVSYSESFRMVECGEEDIFIIHCDNISCFAGMSCPKDLFTKEELIKNWNKRI